MSGYPASESMQYLEVLQQKLGYRYNDPDLLLQALTHSSYANERHLEHNERLEFLGDAVLELSISNLLFYSFPKAAEGDMTKLRASLVSEPTLAYVARGLNLGQYIRLGKGEEQQGGRDRDSVLADTLEAVLGSMYLDSSYNECYEYVIRLFEDLLPEQIDVLSNSKDYKSRLQESTQCLFKARPVYTLIDSYGPEHEKTYLVQVELPNGSRIQARASSVKKAEQSAADKALKHLGSLTRDQEQAQEI